MTNNSFDKLQPREAAYLALLSAAREEGFISDTLHAWQKKTQPDSRDYNLAQEIAYGTCRMALSLDYIAKKLTNGPLTLKRKERLLVHTALYQHYFMERIPLYALTDETVNIAKRHCHTTFVHFLNAILRKASTTESSIPQDDSLESLSIRFSLPPFFITNLIESYGLEKAKEIMLTSNLPPVLMGRIRNKDSSLPEGTEPLQQRDPSFVKVKDVKTLPTLIESSNFYIQNITPAELFNSLTINKDAPKAILDLCAAPGGKLLLAHDIYPEASLHANDLTQQKINLLNENIEKYQLNVKVQCGPGEHYSSQEKFDLIILDVPCSNSGVLNKRPEARWRLSKSNIEKQNQIQKALLTQALTLLNKGGEVWYMTCSILKDENENLVEAVAKECNAKIRIMKTILPDSEGRDGGFAAALHRD